MSNQESTASNKKTHFFGLDVESTYTPYILIGIVILLWSVCWIGVSFMYEDKAHRGQFGDMFGAVNALFSGLAFSGIILTILLQREELKAQRNDLELNRQQLVLNREELIMTRKELEGQKKEFQKQNITLKRQRFESTFFTMLSIHFKIIENLQFKNETGMRAFRPMIEMYQGKITDYQNKKRNKIRKPQELEKEFLMEYTQLNSQYLPYFSPYIQSVVQLHAVIAETKFKSKKSKLRYFNVLKSYLSQYERVFLYYHIPYNRNQGLISLEQDLEIVRDTLNENKIDIPHPSVAYELMGSKN